MEKQKTQRPDLLADMAEIQGYLEVTSVGVSEDISEKCLLGKWLIEEPYALIGHVRFCEGLLRLEPLIAEKFEMKGSEKSRQSLLDEWYGNQGKTVNRSYFYFIGLGCQKAYLKAAFYLYLENLTRLCLELIKDSIGEWLEVHIFLCFLCRFFFKGTMYQAIFIIQ